MQVTLDTDSSRFMVHAYDDRGITLLRPIQLVEDYPKRQVRVETSLILSPSRLLTWVPKHLEELAEAHFEAVLGLEPEVVLLGVGRRLRFPAPGVLAPLHRAGVGVEVMDTAAACRTFNILSSEGRAVVAAMLMLGEA